MKNFTSRSTGGIQTRWRYQLRNALFEDHDFKCRGEYATDSRSTRLRALQIGQYVATHLDRSWRKSRTAQNGPIKVVDMFSGCGGMSAGFQAVNSVFPIYELCGAIDIDETANESYRENLKVTPEAVDVSALARSKKALSKFVDARAIDAAPAKVLIGCAPCQGFSSHRNEWGANDDRNSLFVDFTRIAAALKPDAVVIENVPELLTEKYWPYVERSRAILEREGYFVHVGVHNMAAFGVPQERFRALFLAMRKPFAPPNGFLTRSAFRTVRNAIGHLVPVKAGQRDARDPLHFSAAHHASTVKTIRAVPKDGGSRPQHVGPDCLRRAKIKSGKAVYEDVYGRLHWDKPAITITAYSRNPASGRFVHPDQDRGLTIREAALLQGFPADFMLSGSLDACFRQVGNAVPPSFSAYLSMHILGELLSERFHGDFDRGIVSPVGLSFSRMIPSLKSNGSPRRIEK